MFRKYTTFELKVLLRNRKQLLIGLFLIVFFPLYFQYFISTEPDSLEASKTEERETQILLLNGLPHDLRDTEEGQAIYDKHTGQLSMINHQLISLDGNWTEAYIYYGQTLNMLRMQLHELGNPHVPNQYIVPIEEIKKENAIYNYLDENNLRLQVNPYVGSQFLVASAQIVSGLLIYMVVLLFCSDILIYGSSHSSVIKSLPLSFATKLSSKAILNFLFIISCLSIGVMLGYYRMFKMGGKGNIEYPILIYENSKFVAVSIEKYLHISLIGIIISILIVLFIAFLFNMIFKNVYFTALAGTGLFFLPDLFNAFGMHVKFLYPIKYIDITAVLSGEIAEQFEASYIDYSHSIQWMIVFLITIIVLTFVKNWFTYRQVKLV